MKRTILAVAESNPLFAFIAGLLVADYVGRTGVGIAVVAYVALMLAATVIRAFEVRRIRREMREVNARIAAEAGRKRRWGA